MFQGIVVGLGRIENVEERANFRRLGIDLSGLVHPKNGDSVSINGTCLTVTDIEKNIAFFDIIAETLDKTNLGKLSVGDKVNLENPINLGSEISGHLVQGHVESVATVTKRFKEGDDVRMFFTIPEHLNEHIFLKGSIAIDGVSMTVASMDKEDGIFSVAIIPETLRKTTLGFKKEGDYVNLETDFLMKSMSGQFRRVFTESLEELTDNIKKLESRISRLEKDGAKK